MGKKLLAFIGINVLVIICGALFLWHSYNPEPFNDLGMTRLQAGKVVSNVEHESRSAGEIKIMAGFCAILLVGCTIGLFYRKVKKDKTEFASKNHAHVAGDPISKDEIQTTSLRDWTIALLILSGGLLLPVVIAVFFGFSHFW